MQVPGWGWSLGERDSSWLSRSGVGCQTVLRPTVQRPFSQDRKVIGKEFLAELLIRSRSHLAGGRRHVRVRGDNIPSGCNTSRITSPRHRSGNTPHVVVKHDSPWVKERQDRLERLVRESWV